MTDPLLVGLLVGLGLVALASLWFIWHHVFRRNAAGIRTSLFARGAQVSSLLTRSTSTTSSTATPILATASSTRTEA